MIGDLEYPFSTLQSVGSIVLSPERGVVEFRQTLLREARVSLFPLRSLSPPWSFARVIAPIHIGLLVCFVLTVFATIGIDLLQPHMPRSRAPIGYLGINILWAWIAVSSCFVYLIWRDSRVRWYTFFGSGSGPNFAFPEDQTGGTKARDFAEQIERAIQASRLVSGGWN